MQDLANQFLTFCRSKPADEGYDYSDTDSCALCQFLRMAGYPVFTVGGTFWFDDNHVKHPIPEPLRGLLHDGERNFSALADRLEAALKAA